MSYSFFNEHKDWSEIKHRILKKYLQPYCYKLGSWNKEIFYVDGFAGPGVYKDGDIGSPLIAVDWARQFQQEGRPFTLRCLNVEQNKKFFDQLREYTLELEIEGWVKNFYGAFEDKIENIFGIIKDSPAFFFIDPFGMSPLKFEVLKPILERKAKSTELLMNFSLKGLQRLAGNLDAKVTTEQAKRAADTKVKVLSQVLNTDKWIEIWRSKLKQKERDEKILRLYLENLYTYFTYVHSYPIRKYVKSHPKYFLIFASRNFDAVELMNDFIYDEEHDLRLYTYSSKDLFENQEEEQLFQKIKKEAHLLGMKAKQTTRKKIREKLMPQMFGCLKRKDYDRAVRELDKDGNIKRDSVKAIQDDELLKFVTAPGRQSEN